MYMVIDANRKANYAKSIETLQSGKEEAPVTLMDHLKETWICLGCNRSFLHHYEVVNHMHSENHVVMVNSDFGQINRILEAEIGNMLMRLLSN
jgi:hypothetical protein